MLYKIVLFFSGEHDAGNHGRSAGDFKLFSKLDVDGSTGFSIEEWLEYLIKTHLAKSKTKVERGDKWLHTLLHTIRRGCGLKVAEEEEDEDDEEEEVLQRVGLTSAMLIEAGRVFSLIAALQGSEDPDVMSKDQLVQAQGADFKIYEAMDLDKSGQVGLPEFLAWLETSHAAKAAKRLEKGDKWVVNMLFSLGRGCGVGGFTEEQEEVPHAAQRSP